MKAITQKVCGQVVTHDGQTALHIESLEVTDTASAVLYLRFPFTVRGTEEPIFPAFLLDDWGTEVKGLELYQWVHDYGEQFPRGELFGFELDDRETQCFLRALELHVAFPCYVYPQKETPLNEGLLVTAVLWPGGQTSVPEPIKRPSELPLPLRRAKVSWWQISP